jgi:hypothetical protein
MPMGYLSLSAKRQKRRSEPETGAEVFRRELQSVSMDRLILRLIESFDEIQAGRRTALRG